ncbi:MAG: hypothetical protein IPO09_19045 [Anaeromyxobacter sp.]|nr:hypothetical protein [Anaeromyxobacter sp.]MBL0276005.1 hypothetical protein [Anaeromyxobacter sp.]
MSGALFTESARRLDTMRLAALNLATAEGEPIRFGRAELERRLATLALAALSYADAVREVRP